MIALKDIKQTCKVSLIFFGYWLITALVFSVLMKIYIYFALEAHIIDMPSEDLEAIEIELDKFDVSKTLDTIKTISMVTKYFSIAIASYGVFFLKPRMGNTVTILAISMICMLMGILFFAIGLPKTEALYQLLAFILLSSFFWVISKRFRTKITGSAFTE